MIRPPRFAGSWYPGEPDALRAAIDEALDLVAGEVTPAPALLLVAPHAGYRYSLKIAAAGYARVVVPDTVVVLCPNHRAPPGVVSVWPDGAWRTPLGDLAVDAELAARLVAGHPGASADRTAHADEHAVELHLPILQRVRERQGQAGPRIVPVVVAARREAELLALGDALAAAIASAASGRATVPREDVLIVASTDMTHHLPAAVARAQDERALAALLALDAPRLLAVCERERISMCGVRPTVAGLRAALARGATRAALARYGHSGEVSGDDERVVGYASVVVV